MTALKRSPGITAARFALVGLLGGTLWVALGSCKLPTTNGNGGTPIDIDFNLATQTTLAIDFTGADSANVRLLNVAPGQLYLAKANLSVSTATAAATGGCGILRGAAGRRTGDHRGPIRRAVGRRGSRRSNTSKWPTHGQ